VSGSGNDNWEDHWAKYAKVTEENPAHLYRRKLIFDQIDTLLRQSAAVSRIVDIGCGQGDLLREIRARYPKMQLLGVDLSKKGLEFAQRKIDDGHFLCLNLETQSASESGFESWGDVAICSEVLEHVNAPQSVVINALTFLKDGGKLVLTVPGGVKTYFDTHIGHRRHFTKLTLAEVVTTNHSTILNMQSAGFPFFNLYKLVIGLRGKKLIEDLASDSSSKNSNIMKYTMAVFNFLFRFNLDNSRFGWQIIAVIRK
jgi:2-polyprenyl-3-methyl-5-hydroxy-6-metoxy-1,4-benzoquinol methylase